MMSTTNEEPNGATRLSYILGVPLADEMVRQWPQKTSNPRVPVRLLGRGGSRELP